MNTNELLLERLLKLYPYKVVKNEFDIKGGTQNDKLPEVVASNSPVIVRDFAIEHASLTRQHVYIYKLDKNFDRNKFIEKDFPIEIKKEIVANPSYTFTCFPIVKYEVLLTNPVENDEIHFYQPVVITVQGKFLIIHVTIMEKQLSHYVDSKRKVMELGKKNSEPEIVNSILKFFDQTYTVQICDINKGIKKLWKEDIIDSKYAKWKKDRSTSTESMDEEFTLKVQYPELYASLLNSPLGRTVFKYLKDDNEFCSHFTADPSQGQVTIPIFPESLNQTRNVINSIISNN
jgi:hypothetical protein